MRHPHRQRNPPLLRSPRLSTRTSRPTSRSRRQTTRKTPSSRAVTRSGPERDWQTGPQPGHGRLRAISRQRVPGWIELHGLLDPAEVVLDPRIDARLAIARAALFAPADDTHGFRRTVRKRQRAAAVALAGRALRMAGADDRATDAFGTVRGPLPAGVVVHRAQVDLHQHGAWRMTLDGLRLAPARTGDLRTRGDLAFKQRNRPDQCRVAAT